MAEPEEFVDPGIRFDPDDRDFEAPDADVAEQATPVDPAELPTVVNRGLEVDEFDAWEQSQVVELDDDYR